MGRRHLLYLLYTSSVRPPFAATPYLVAPPPHFLFRKGYNRETNTESHVTDDTINHERAPSTLEEFKRLEEEKANEGVLSQTVDKAKDGFMEATTGKGDVETVKESIKKVSGDGDASKTGDFHSTK